MNNTELKKELKCWAKLLEVYGINNERMSAALSYAFGDEHCDIDYLKGILSLSAEDLEWYRVTHGDEEE